MIQRCILVLCLWAAAVTAARAQLRDRPAPFYSFPAEGTWLEYEWKSRSGDNKRQEGTLRISFVGRKEVHGVKCYWIETKKETRLDSATEYRTRKLLVPEKALTSGEPLHASVVE